MLCGVALLLFTVALSPSTTPVDGAANVDGAVGSAGMLRRPSVVLESALAKPRPSGTYGAGRPILPIHCAKNEAESFLVVVSGGDVCAVFVIWQSVSSVLFTSHINDRIGGRAAL